MDRDKLRLIIGWGLFIILELFIVSCHSDSKVTDLLRRAALSMEVQPDSVLHLLEQISAPDELSNKERAEYYLLLAQARDKNYMDMSSDSSVVFSVDYFREKGDNKKYGKALYYYGRVVQTKGEGTRAMALFLEACRVLEGTGENKLMGLAYEDMSILNWQQSFYDESLRCCRLSIDYYHVSKNLLNVAYAYQTMGRSFFMKKEMDSVSWYATNSLRLLSDNPVRLKIGAYKLLGMVYTYQKDYSQAEKMLLDVLREEPDSSKLYYHYMALGHLYQSMGRRKDARKFLFISADSPDLFTCSDAYGCLSNLASEDGNFEEALQFKDKEDSISTLAENDKIRENFVQLQTKYEKEKINKERLQMKLDKQTLHIVYAVLLGLTIGVLYYLYRKYWHTKWQLARIRKTMKENEHRIYLLQDEVETFRNEKTKRNIETDLQIIGLHNNIEELIRQNEKLSKRIGKNIDVLALVISLKNKEVIAEKLSLLEWNAIFNLVNCLCSDFLIQLAKTGPQFTKHNIQFLSLLLLGFSNKELMIVFDHKDINSILKAKGRLKERLGLSKEESFELFLQKIREGK